MFKLFKTLRLRKNMRADPDQVEFSKWLCEIGAGKKYVKGTKEIEIPQENLANSANELLDFCFKDLFKSPLNKSDEISDAAVLAPKNDNVAYLNELALSKLPGKPKLYKSLDAPLLSDKARQDPMSIYRADFNIEAVHNYTPTGLPPHLLELKVRCFCLTFSPNFQIPNIEGWRSGYVDKEYGCSQGSLQWNKAPDNSNDGGASHLPYIDWTKEGSNGVHPQDTH